MMSDEEFEAAMQKAWRRMDALGDAVKNITGASE
tara:strand:+ start:623 stop:724 length:102 start_codon:yes stop_codon:yes gene_type:complete